MLVKCPGEHTEDPVLTQLVLKRHVCIGCRHAPPIRDINQIQHQGIETDRERERGGKESEDLVILKQEITLEEVPTGTGLTIAKICPIKGGDFSSVVLITFTLADHIFILSTLLRPWVFEGCLVLCATETLA